MMRGRGGSIYFIVLGVCLLVTLIGMGAVLAARVQARVVSQTSDCGGARLYARSGIELGTYLANQANFRSTYSNGVWLSGQHIGDGSFTLSGVNATANLPLNNEDTDPVNLTVTGYKGAAVHITQVQLVSRPVPLGCLETSADFGGGVTLGTLLSQANVTCFSNPPLSTNGLLTTAMANLNGRFEAAGGFSIGLLTGGTYTTKTISSPRALPDPAHAFDYYKMHGTSIPPSSVYSASAGGYVLQNCVLSATANPFGPANTQGIYVIDFGTLGGAITIQNCQIAGTLVVLNALSGSNVAGSVSWSAAVSNYPCLMVQCVAGSSLSLQYTNAPLAASAIGVSGTQTYASAINGLIYCSGDVTVANTVTITGVLIANGALTCSGGTMNLTYNGIYDKNPPPGFCQTPVRMVPAGGTFAQATN